MRSILSVMIKILFSIVEICILATFFIILIIVIGGKINYPIFKFGGTEFVVGNIYRPFIALVALSLIRYALKYTGIAKTDNNLFNNPIYFLILFAIIYLAFVIPFLLNKYYSFSIGIPHDFSLFNQAVYNTAHGMPLKVTMFGHLPIHNWNILGDHIFLILLLFSPLYYFFQDGAFLWVLLAIFLASGVFPTYFIANNVLKNKWVALFISIIYLLYPVMTHCYFYACNPEVFAIPLFLFAFLFLQKRWIFLFIVFLGFGLSCKEMALLIGVGFGIYIAFFKRDIKHHFILGTLVTSLCAGLFFWVVKYLMPSIVPQGYNQMQWCMGYMELLYKPWEITKFYNQENAQYFIRVFKYLGFIPIFSPMILIGFFAFLQNYLTPPLQTVCHTWHSALMVPFLIIGFIYGLKNLLTLAKRWINIKTAIFICAFFIPLWFGINDFYNYIMKPIFDNKLFLSYKPEIYKEFETAREYMAGNGSLFTTCRFLPNLSNRKEIYWVYNFYKAKDVNTDYVFYSPIGYNLFSEEMDMCKGLLIDPRYSKLYVSDKFVVLANKYKYTCKKNVKWNLRFNELRNSKFNLANTDYKSLDYKSLIDKRDVLGVELYFNGNSKEDEFLQICPKRRTIGINKYPYFDFVYKIEDTKVGIIQLVLGVDFNGDEIEDEYIRLNYSSFYHGGWTKRKINLLELVRKEFPDKEDYKVVMVEIYPHKIWWLDCSKRSKKGSYKFWIKRLTFYNIQANERRR